MRSRRLRTADRVLSMLTYGMGMVSGTAVILWPPSLYAETADLLHTLWGVLCLGSGLALWGVIARRPLWEWRGVILLALGLAVYAGLSWETVYSEGQVHVARASALAVAALTLSGRFVKLWIQVTDAEDYAAIGREVRR